MTEGLAHAAVEVKGSDLRSIVHQTWITSGAALYPVSFGQTGKDVAQEEGSGSVTASELAVEIVHETDFFRFGVELLFIGVFCVLPVLSLQTLVAQFLKVPKRSRFLSAVRMHCHGMLALWSISTTSRPSPTRVISNFTFYMVLLFCAVRTPLAVLTRRTLDFTNKDILMADDPEPRIGSDCVWQFKKISVCHISSFLKLACCYTPVRSQS